MENKYQKNQSLCSMLMAIDSKSKNRERERDP